MKTQILISSMLLFAALFSNFDSKADSDSFSVKKINEITVPDKININEEENLQIEDWMSDDNLWKLPNVSDVFCIETEEAEIQIEDWMTSDSFFRISSEKIDKEKPETTLCIEGWMTDQKYWRF